MSDIVYAYDPHGLLQPLADVPAHWKVSADWHSIPLEIAALLIAWKFLLCPLLIYVVGYWLMIHWVIMH